MSDRQVLVQGKKLTDKHMDAAQKLMQDQFPHLQGLQSTLLSQKRDSIVSVSESGGFLAEGKKTHSYILCMLTVAVLKAKYCRGYIYIG